MGAGGSAHVWEAEGVTEDAGGEEGGDDGLEAVGDVPGREAVPHAREQRHALRLVPRPHLPAHASRQLLLLETKEQAFLFQRQLC